MKTSIAKLTLITAWMVAATPADSFAQNISSHPTVNRNLDRLTLLPGPYLLSPARPAPSAGVLTLQPAAPDVRWQFVPGPRFPVSQGVTVGSGLIRSGTGTLTLSDSTYFPAFGVAGSKKKTESNETPPTLSDELRFDAKLSSPVPTSIKPGTPLPFKRD